MVRQNTDKEELNGNLPRSQRINKQVWGIWEVLKPLSQALKLLRLMNGIWTMP
jgi:hypothetical protein